MGSLTSHRSTMVRKIIFSIVPERLRTKPSHKIISGLLVQLLFLGLLGCVIYGSLYYAAGSDILVVTALITATAFLALLASFRVVSKTRYITYGFIITLYFAYSSQIYFTGGPDSPVLANLVLLPMITLLPGLGRDWYILLIISVATILGFSAMSFLFDYNFPNELIGVTGTIFNMLGAAFPYVVLVVLLPMFMNQVANANTNLRKAFVKLKSTSKRLVESEKLASLGQLTAGIAHEINNPVNYTLGSAQYLKKGINELVQYEKYRAELWVRVEKALESGEIIDSKEILQKTVQDNYARREDIDYDHLLEELTTLMDSVETGASRTAEIVKGLRTFSRLDDSEFKLVDLRESIDSTLILLQNKVKDRIKVKRKYADLPPVECNPSKINQVLLNLISNAIQAISDEGFIKIFATYNVGLQQVTIKVEDSGQGIPKSIESEIFNPFFTTKEVGEGTGLGLSMCKGIVEEHHGRLFFRSLPGVGTTFFVELPVAQPKGLTSHAQKEDPDWQEDTGSLIS